MDFVSYFDARGRQVMVRPAGVSGFCAWVDSGPDTVGRISSRTKWKSVGCFGHTIFDAQRSLDAEAARKCWTVEP